MNSYSPTPTQSHVPIYGAHFARHFVISARIFLSNIVGVFSPTLRIAHCFGRCNIRRSNLILMMQTDNRNKLQMIHKKPHRTTRVNKISANNIAEKNTSPQQISHWNRTKEPMHSHIHPIHTRRVFLELCNLAKDLSWLAYLHTEKNDESLFKTARFPWKWNEFHYFSTAHICLFIPLSDIAEKAMFFVWRLLMMMTINLLSI